MSGQTQTGLRDGQILMLLHCCRYAGNTKSQESGVRPQSNDNVRLKKLKKVSIPCRADEHSLAASGRGNLHVQGRGHQAVIKLLSSLLVCGNVSNFSHFYSTFSADGEL